MASQALAKFYALANRSKETLRRIREKERTHSNELMVRAGTAASTVVGNVVAGAIDGKWGYDKAAFSDSAEKNGIAQVGPVPINAGAGLVLLAVGIPGIVPGSEYLASFGAGMLGYTLGKSVEAKVHEKA